MKTLIKPEVKLKIASFDNFNCQVKEKSNNSKFGLDFNFYQRLFVILFASCSLLIDRELANAMQPSFLIDFAK